jgi:hypothetical protein
MGICNFVVMDDFGLPWDLVSGDGFVMVHDG